MAGMDEFLQQEMAGTPELSQAMELEAQQTEEAPQPAVDPGQTEPEHPQAETKPEGWIPEDQWKKKKKDDRFNDYYAKAMEYDRLKAAGLIVEKPIIEAQQQIRKELDKLKADKYEEKMAELQSRAKSAIEQGDLSGYHIINEEIMEKKLKRERKLMKREVSPNIAPNLQQTQQYAPSYPQLPQQPVPSQAFYEFKERNPWFGGGDPASKARTQLAAATDNLLMVDPYWAAQPEGARYQEVERRIAVGPTQGGGGGVEAPTNGGMRPRAAANEVHLSHEEITFATQVLYRDMPRDAAIKEAKAAKAAMMSKSSSFPIFKYNGGK
jgi:hypothetical protein